MAATSATVIWHVYISAFLAIALVTPICGHSDAVSGEFSVSTTKRVVTVIR